MQLDHNLQSTFCALFFLFLISTVIIAFEEFDPDLKYASSFFNEWMLEPFAVSLSFVVVESERKLSLTHHHGATNDLRLDFLSLKQVFIVMGDMSRLPSLSY